MKTIVVDTSVLMDIEFVHRGRHEAGKALAQKLRNEGSLVVVPAHWFFEYLSAVLCEKRRIGAPLAQGEFKNGPPFLMKMVPIDDVFIKDYLLATINDNIVDLKSGDMIFALIALKDKLPIITEDRKLHAIASKLGIRAFTIDEYLSEK
jgi:predicted nucleic acid-binding protein